MSDLQTLLTEFAAERVALIERHEASARAVSHYDFNNTYQYVINREETHLSWLQNALAEYHAVVPPAGAAALPAPTAPKTGRKVEAGAFRGILDDDARYLGAFVEKWRPRVDVVTHARHRNMLNVVVGESIEVDAACPFQQKLELVQDVAEKDLIGLHATRPRARQMA